jgi:hypothetical protein
MPYIPERRFEDKPDTFSPFVPMDGDNIVEKCESQLNDAPIKKSDNKKTLKIVLLLFLVYLLLKQYKII